LLLLYVGKLKHHAQLRSELCQREHQPGLRAASSPVPYPWCTFSSEPLVRFSRPVHYQPRSDHQVNRRRYLHCCKPSPICPVCLWWILAVASSLDYCFPCSLSLLRHLRTKPVLEISNCSQSSSPSNPTTPPK